MACPGCSCGQAEIELARSVDKIEIKQKDPSKLMTGMNTVVLLNGVPLKHASSIEVKVDAKGMGIVKIEMYANVTMDEAVVKDAEITGGEEKSGT